MKIQLVCLIPCHEAVEQCVTVCVNSKMQYPVYIIQVGNHNTCPGGIPDAITDNYPHFMAQEGAGDSQERNPISPPPSSLRLARLQAPPLTIQRLLATFAAVPGITAAAGILHCCAQACSSGQYPPLLLLGSTEATGNCCHCTWAQSSSQHPSVLQLRLT